MKKRIFAILAILVLAVTAVFCLIGKCNMDASKPDYSAEGIARIGQLYCHDSHYEVPEENPYFASYNGALYTKDYSTLLRWPRTISSADLRRYQVVHNPALGSSGRLVLDVSAFHPNLQIIGDGAFSQLDILDTIVIPWGVTTLEPEAFAHIQMVTVLLPDTVVHFSDENVFYERQWSNYLCSYYTAARKSLHCDARPLVENPELWYEAYGISEEDLDNWICRNGRLYYLFRTELYSGTYHKMATGPQTIDGVSYLFDESGALQQADLPAGNYTFGEASFTVDEEGKVKAK